MSRTPAVPSAACPCGRLQGSGAKAKPLAYADCCGRFIDHWDAQPAPDAECLMRSRYTAFVCERADYLLATWHPSHRPASLDFDAAAQWLGLEVRGHWVKDADHAEVEFVARHRLGGRAVRLHERSRFVREGGRWYYVDGDMLPVR
uniref:YchJ family protein n=1 Tax=uncultured Acidovorax sp. TaxID=158751 RepID=UPI0030F548D7